MVDEVCTGDGSVDFFFFQAEDGIRDIGVTGVQRVLFRSQTPQFKFLTGSDPGGDFIMVVPPNEQEMINVMNKIGRASCRERV